MEFPLNIAQIRLGIKIPDGCQGEYLFPSYYSFVSVNHSCDSWVVFHDFPTMNNGSLTPLSDREVEEKTLQYPILKNPQARDAYIKYHNDPHSFIILKTISLVVFQADIRVMQIFTFSNTADVPRLIENYTVSILACLLSGKGGLLLHGAGFEKSGGVAVAVGPSGAGKSTFIRHLSYDFLLSEDIVAITNIGSDPLVHSTPLGGPTDGPRSALLRAIFFVTKSRDFSLRRMGFHEAIHRYVLEHADYVSRLFKPYVALCFKNAYSLFSKVPAYEVCFSKEYIDQDAIYRILQSPGYMNNDFR